MMSSQSIQYSDYICLQCATFNISNAKGLVCENCGFIPKRNQLKTVHNYAKYIFRYGHTCRNTYQKQLDRQGQVGVKFALGDPDTLYTYIGVAMLSGVLGNFAWEVVKNTASQIIKSYNYRYKKAEVITEIELRSIYESYEIFLNHFDEIDKNVRDSILEEILAHESGKQTKKVMHNNLMYAISENKKEQQKLKKMNERLAKKVSKEIGRKLKKLKRAENENFQDYWGKIKIE